MTLQLGTIIRNARLDAIETAVNAGGAPILLRIFTGAAPANCAAANSGTALATITLPTDWMNNASGATKTKLGTWQDTAADNSGTAGHFRIVDSFSACHFQGTVGVSGADMIVDSVTFLVGQVFTILSFTITAGNA